MPETTTVTIPAEYQSGEQLRQAQAAGLTPAEARDWWSRVVERVCRARPRWTWRADWSEVVVPTADRAAAQTAATETIAAAIAAEPYDPRDPEATR